MSKELYYTYTAEVPGVAREKFEFGKKLCYYKDGFDCKCVCQSVFINLHIACL